MKRLSDNRRVNLVRWRPVPIWAAFFAMWAAAAGLIYIGLVATPAIAQVQQLPREPLTVYTERGEFAFQVEIADEPQERTIGLMNRPHMAPDHGMLFEFEAEQVAVMWMKNTLISLDMVFIAADGTVATIAERTTPHSTDIITSRVPVTHVLEINGGMADYIGLKPGDRIDHRHFE